jgi:hypothetical protein
MLKARLVVTENFVLLLLSLRIQVAANAPGVWAATALAQHALLQTFLVS